MAALRRANLDVFLDVDDIDALVEFPERIRQKLVESHALLVWWSLDYADSEYCMQEFRLAWQHARRRSSDVGRRIWIVNPEHSVDHIFAGELASTNFLAPPPTGSEVQWAQAVSARAQKLLIEGPFANEPGAEALPDGQLFGVPAFSAQFTGRERELWKVHSLLHPAQIEQARVAPVQIVGEGGIGKTELVAKYAAEFSASYSGGLFWLSFSGFESATYSESNAEAAWLAAAKVALATHPLVISKQLRFKDDNDKDLSLIEVRSRLDALLGDRSSLWVLDNVPIIRPESLRDKILSTWAASSWLRHTVITTRDTRPISMTEPISLDVLQHQDAVRMLARFRDPGPDLQIASELVQEVGAHTLALALLGRRLQRASGGYPSVLKSIQDRGLLERIEELAKWGREELQLGDSVRGILATFASSFESISQAAVDMLAIASTCAPNEPLPSWMIRECYIRGQSPEADRTSFIDRVDAALAELVDFSLLRQRGKEGIGSRLEIHRLIAAAFWAHTGIAIAPVQDALGYLLLSRATFPDRVESDDSCPIDPHIRYLVETGQPLLSTRLALRFSTTDEWLLQRMVEVAKRHWGREHPYSLVAMNNMAFARYSEEPELAMENLTEVAAAIHKRLPHSNPIRLQIELARASVLNLDWFRSGRRESLSEAQQIANEALATARRDLGGDHPMTISTMRLLSSICWCLQDLIATRQLDEEILSHLARLLGDEDPRTKAVKANLDLTARSKGFRTHIARWVVGLLSGGLALDKRGFRTYMARWDAEHPRILLAMATIARESGDANGARFFLSQAVDDVSKIVIQEIEENRHLISLKGRYIDTIDEYEFIGLKLDGKFTRVTREVEHQFGQDITIAKRKEDGRSLGMAQGFNRLAADFDVLEVMQAIGRKLGEIEEFNDACFLYETAVDLQRKFLGGPRADTVSELEKLTRLRDRPKSGDIAPN